MSTAPAPDVAAMVAFVRALPELPWFTATALVPDRAQETIYSLTFTKAEVESVAERFAKANREGYNVYLHVNAMREKMSGKGVKPRKAHVRLVYAIHGDVDPRDGEPIEAERARLVAQFTESGAMGLPPPSLVAMSGSGVQAYWFLKEPVALAPDDADKATKERVAEEFERYTRGVEAALGDADSTHNVDRMFRWIGSVNHPDAKKRAKGRAAALSYMVEHHPERLYAPTDFPLAPPKGGVAPSANAKRIGHVDELAGVGERCKQCIVNGYIPDDPNGRADGQPDHFPSRSERVLWVCCELTRAGIAPETIYGILTDPQWAISESVREKGRGADRYAQRQIDRAAAEVANEGADFQEHEGKKLPTQHNARVFLQREGVRIRYDEFADRFLIDGLPGFGPNFDDKASTRLRLLARSEYQLGISREDWSDFLTDLALYHRFHPVRDYLDSLAWDGAPRIDRWLVTYGMAEDSEYVRAVGALVLIAGVRRIMEPGCKFDEMLVLEGLQGKNKSTALATLAVREEWFSDDLPLDADTKRFIEAIAGKWIVEAGELKGMRKGEVDALKSTLSRRFDRARLAYGRHPVELPRQCIIIGSTNSEHYLKDATGNRRFWPVRCGEFDVEGLRRDRDQLWAEARVREARGESIRLSPSLYPAAGEAQEARRLSDPFEEALEAHLAGRVGKLRAHDVWVIVGKADVGRRTQEDMNRLGEVMRRMGWVRTKRRFGATHPEWCYVRGSKAEQEQRLFVFIDPASGEVSSVGSEGEVPEYGAGGGA